MYNYNYVGSFPNESQREIRLRRWSSSKEFACQCKRQRRWKFHPWVGEIPWRRAWQSTPLFLPGKSHRQRSLVVCISMGSQKGQTWLNTQREIALLKSKYKYFYISKQKTLRKKFVNKITLKKHSKSYLDSRKMILKHKIKIQERIKGNWYRYLKYINLNEYCLCKQW